MHRFWFALLLISCAPAFAGVQVEDGKMTADIQAQRLGDVMNQIGTLAGLEISINGSAANETIYASFEDVPIGAAIRKLLEGTDINFAVIGAADGTPTAVFLSKSESPGAPPKKLDTRPVTSPGRGVVQPIVSQPPPQSVPPQNPGNRGNAPGRSNKEAVEQQKPFGGNSVPTGGSFSGSPPLTVQPNPLVNKPDEDPQSEDNSDEDDDEEE